MAHQTIPRITRAAKEDFERQIEEVIKEEGDRASLMQSWGALLEKENPVLLEAIKEAARQHADLQVAMYHLFKFYALLHFQGEEHPHVLH